MLNMHLNTASLLSLLTSIIERWPKTETDDLEGIESTLRKNLADDFDALDFQNRVKSVAKLEKVEPRSDGAVIDFYDEDGYLQRAIFELSASDEWKLRSLKFQCPVCFGSGENDGDTCTMCGGGGWGVS